MSICQGMDMLYKSGSIGMMRRNFMWISDNLKQYFKDKENKMLKR